VHCVAIILSLYTDIHVVFEWNFFCLIACNILYRTNSNFEHKTIILIEVSAQVNNDFLRNFSDYCQCIAYKTYKSLLSPIFLVVVIEQLFITFHLLMVRVITIFSLMSNFRKRNTILRNISLNSKLLLN